MQNFLAPGTRLGETPSFYKLNSLTFEELCRDLFATEPDISTCEIYGNPGQPQEGIDLLAYRKNNDGIEVGQCKCYETFRPAKIRAASDEFFKYWENRWSKENVKRFILFVASELKSRQQHSEIANQKKRFAEYGIEYEAWSASTIRNKLRPHPGIVANYLFPKEHWVSIICGTTQDSLPNSFTNTPSILNAVFANQFEKLGELLSQETELRISYMKEVWQEGGKTEVLQQIQELRNNSDHWSVLPPKIRAQFLCFEGNAELYSSGNIVRAKQLLDQASVLASTGSTARLRASIAFWEGHLETAIAYLETWADPESLQLKAALYLEIGKPVECMQVLESGILASTPSAESHRLRALSHLVMKEISQAQLEIQKALELKPSWESIRFSAGLIDYYSAISEAMFSELLVISPDPIDWMFVRQDDESLIKLRRAAAYFLDLVEATEQTQVDSKRLHAWYLASLANDPESQEKAASLCKSLLDVDPLFTPGIAWALLRNYSINLEAVETALEALVTNNSASIPHLIVLINCYIAEQKLDRAAAILEHTENLFKENNASSAWLFALSQVRILQNSIEEILVQLNSYEDRTTFYARILLLSARARQTNDWQQLNNFLQEIYAISNDPKLLLQICEFKAEQQDWESVIESTETLLKNFGTTEVLTFVAIAAYNGENFALCLQLIDKNQHLFPRSKLPGNLRQIRVLCQSELGVLSAAIHNAEELVSENPNLDNSLILINLYLKKGDFNGLSLVARQIHEQQDLPPEIALQLARLLSPKDRLLALSLWKHAITQDLPDALVGEAFFLGNQLGLRSELKPLSLRLQKLAQEGREGIVSIPIHELAETMQNIYELGMKVDEAYREGKVPIHFVVQELNSSLPMLYHYDLLEKEKHPNPFRDPPLLIRHGGRIPMNGFPTNVIDLNVHLDITSLLLAEHLNILPKVERAFAPLHISAELIPALVQMRERITPHQPTRIEDKKRIVELVKQGSLKIINDELPNEYSETSLAAEMGREWITLYAICRSSQGYLVDFLPLRKKEDLSGDPPSFLPEDIEDHLINCRAILESLLQHDPLFASKYDEALNDLGADGLSEPSKAIPFPDSDLFCTIPILETLAWANLITLVCEHFKVHTSKESYDRIQSDLAHYSQMLSTVQWVDQLISWLNKGLSKGLYQIVSISTDKRQQIKNIRSAHHLDGVLGTLLGFNLNEGDVIWADDRWVNTHRHRDGVPILDIYDILKLLVGAGQITDSEYYQVLHRLRAANVIFLPVQHDEIVYFLKQAHVNTSEHSLIETQQLEVLRKYVASCVLRQNILQLPPTPRGSIDELGERAFIIGLMQATAQALFSIWADEHVSEADHPILCEWIITNLYLENLGLARTAFPKIEEQDEEFQATLGVVALLSAPFMLMSSYLNTAKHLRQGYFSWLYERLLQRRFNVDPPLLSGTVEILKRTFRSLKEEAQEDGPEFIAADILLQSFYEELPLPIQEGLRHDEQFMAAFGLQFIEVITIEELAFESSAFFETAHRVINGQSTIITPHEGNTEIQFEPIENKRGLKFTHPAKDTQVRLMDDRLVLLSDSPAEREAFLFRHRNWFDCPEHQLNEVIAKIAGTENPLLRMKLADSWRDSSAAIYYRDLYHQIRENQIIQFPNLIPPSAERLLTHYRLVQASNVGQTFHETLKTASETLLLEEGLENTIYRLVGFPVPLPDPVLDSIRALSELQRLSLVKTLLKTASSPLSKIHLIHVLIQLGPTRSSFYRLAQRIIKNLRSQNAINEFVAFHKVLEWVNSEFAYWQGAAKWQAQTRLAMVWAHAHQLFCVLIANGIPSNWIAEAFSQVTRRLPPEMFNRDPYLWFDVSHPRRLSFPGFFLMGLAYGIGQERGESIDNILESVFTPDTLDDTSQEIDNSVFQTTLIFRDMSRALNGINSFLGGNYNEKIQDLFGTDEDNSLGSVVSESITSQAINELLREPNKLRAWSVLQAVIGDLPPYESLTERLSQLLQQVQFDSILDEELKSGLVYLNFASSQALHLSNENLNQHLSEQFLKVVSYLAQQDWKNQSTNSLNLETTFLILMEVALNTAICDQTMEDKVLTLCDLLMQTVEIWPVSISTIKPIIQVLTEELPVSYGQYLGKLLLRLRAS